MLLQLPTLDQMTDILDIKPIVKVSLLGAWLAGLVLLLLLLFLVYRILKKKEKPVAKPAPRRILSPREAALQELEELEALKLVEKGQFRKYYFRLSEILRHFLQEEIQIPAVDATTEEIRPHLKSSKFLNTEETHTVDRILIDMDLVKFAKFIPSPEEIRRLRDELKAFIRTAPRNSFQSAAVAGKPAPSLSPSAPVVVSFQDKGGRG